jgi:hypothetical protein
MKHLIEKVLPMEDELGVPDEPPMKLQSVSEKYTLGTTSDLVVEHPDINSNGKRLRKFKGCSIGRKNEERRGWRDGS